jgi:hypothetical protein
MILEPKPYWYAIPGNWSFGNQNRETSSSQLPAFLFCRKAIQRFEARLLLCPIWSRHFDAAFRSPTAAACFQTAAGRSTLLARLFDATLELSSNPFDLSLLCSPGLPRKGQALRDKPVARFCSGVLRGYLTSAPLKGFFISPADRSVQFSVPLKSSPCEPPDFPSLPACHSLW